MMLHLEVPELQGISGASDGELIETMRAWARARRQVDVGLATLAGEVAARSNYAHHPTTCCTTNPSP